MNPCILHHNLCTPQLYLNPSRLIVSYVHPVTQQCKSRNTSEIKVATIKAMHHGLCTLLSKGGLPLLHHNEIRDLTATLLNEVHSQVCTEPELQYVNNPDEFHLSTSNTQEGACLDIAMDGFWGGSSQRRFVDVLMSSHAASYYPPCKLWWIFCPSSSHQCFLKEGLF